MKHVGQIIGFVAGFVIVSMAISFIRGSDKLQKFEPYQSKDGNFSVLFPGEPTKQKQPVDTAVGKVDFIMYQAGSKKSGFVVGYCDYPQEAIKGSDPQKMLDGARDGAANNVNGKIVDETKMDFHGHPCREVEIRLPSDMTIRARLILIGNRLYQMMVISPSDDILYEKGTEFFDSFSVGGIG